MAFTKAQVRGQSREVRVGREGLLQVEHLRKQRHRKRKCTGLAGERLVECGWECLVKGGKA